MDSHYVDNLIDEDEIPELSEGDFAQMKQFSELPSQLQHVLREIQAGNVTIRTTEDQLQVPMARSLVEQFQATGNDWETKVDEALRRWLDDHRAS